MYIHVDYITSHIVWAGIQCFHCVYSIATPCCHLLMVHSLRLIPTMFGMWMYYTIWVWCTRSGSSQPCLVCGCSITQECGLVTWQQLLGRLITRKSCTSQETYNIIVSPPTHSQGYLLCVCVCVCLSN